MNISLKGKSVQIINIFQKASRNLIYLLVFLLPIFFLPLTIDPLDFNKQILFGILIFIALIFWAAKIFFSSKLEINFSFLNFPILTFLFIYLISTIFSLSPKESFWGWPLNLNQGLLTLFLFFIFYFLISNIFQKKEDIFLLFLIFLTSTFLATIFAIYQILLKKNSFTTIGTPNSLAIFLATLLPLAILLTINSKKFLRLVLAIYSISFSIFLILINFSLAWFLLITGTLILFISGLLNLKRVEKFDLVFFSMLILIISLFFLSFRISWSGLQIPAEILLNQKTEFQIVKNSFKNVKNFFLGTGPSTFVFDYSKYKPTEINQTAFWSWRFQNGASEIQDKLMTSGILGISSLFFIFLTFFFISLKNLSLRKNQFISLGIFSSFACLLFGQFLYPANFSLLFLFWLILGSLSVLDSKIKTVNFSGHFSLIPAIFLVFIFLFGISFSFIQIRNYLAELRYFQGLKAWQKGELEQAIDLTERAINLNSSLDSYQRDISQLYLARLNQLLQKSEPSNPEIQGLIFKALDSAKKATKISKNNVANWNVRGFVYRNLIGLVDGAEDWAIDSYQKAIELEPKNPYIFNEMGLIYLAKADSLGRESGKEEKSKENLAKAEDNFQRAIELKSDYAPAHFQLAMVYQRGGKTKEAISKLEETELIAPLDSGLAFQLGLLYYNDNQMEKAKSEFLRAISIDENYSNARYFLGLIYDQEGKKDLAIEQFEKIEELNPENLEVKEILENLRAGKSALEGIGPLLPPIEEKQPERLEK